MKFLVDENLPPALARWLRDVGCEARHVRDVGLASTPDADIVRRAIREQEVIVTQDRGLAANAGGDPARLLQIVWVRLGNVSSQLSLELKSGQELVEIEDQGG